ncbi:hypothetical protein KRP22_013107 [Phytophthora ramorum]|nr:hypothetical protein KRP22_11107 [Phytophthora ramorum]
MEASTFKLAKPVVLPEMDRQCSRSNGLQFTYQSAIDQRATSWTVSHIFDECRAAALDSVQDATCYCTIATFACGHQFHNLRVLPRLDEEAKCPLCQKRTPVFGLPFGSCSFKCWCALSGATMNVAYSREMDNVLLPCLDAVAIGKMIAGVSRARQERR